MCGFNAVCQACWPISPTWTKCVCGYKINREDFLDGDFVAFFLFLFYNAALVYSTNTFRKKHAQPWWQFLIGEKLSWDKCNFALAEYKVGYVLRFQHINNTKFSYQNAKFFIIYKIYRKDILDGDFVAFFFFLLLRRPFINYY